MTVLTIRSHKRYAVRQAIRLRQTGAKPVSGLMIELSSEGCRISNLGRPGFAVGEPVSVEVDGIELTGKLRWMHDGIAGVRLDTALFSNQLAELIARGRGEAGELRYGT